VVRARLAPDGLYVLNLIDAWDSGRFLAAVVRTLRQAFPQVEVLGALPRRDDRPATFLVVARALPGEPLGLVADDGRPLPAIRYGEKEVERLLEHTRAPVLRDEFAPVEALLAPVVRLREGGGPRTLR
jgi:hypothetical protein